MILNYLLWHFFQEVQNPIVIKHFQLDLEVFQDDNPDFEGIDFTLKDETIPNSANHILIEAAAVQSQEPIEKIIFDS